MRSSLSKGHQVRVMGAVEHIFNETAMIVWQRQTEQVMVQERAKEGVKKTRENPKDSPKKPKMPKSKSRTSSETQESAQTCPTDIHGFMMDGVFTIGTMAGELMNGMMTGVLSDGTKIGNKRLTLLQNHFLLEVWMSVPRVVRSGLNGWR